MFLLSKNLITCVGKGVSPGRKLPCAKRNKTLKKDLAEKGHGGLGMILKGGLQLYFFKKIKRK